MKKSLLKKIPTQKAKSEYIGLANKTEKKYLVSVDQVQIEENKILLMYFYHQSHLKEGNTKAAFRVFLSIDDYITQDTEGASKWRTGCIRNLIGGWDRWTNQCTLVNDKSSEIIKKFLNTSEDPLEAIEHFQNVIMARRLDNKHKATKDRIDNQMVNVPKLPRIFDKWIDKTALFNSRYIYYTYKSRKQLDGYCTNCNSDVVVEAPRHNAAGMCPACKSPITYKAMGKSRNVIDRGQASLIQRVGEEIIVRYFSICKSYQGNYKEPRISFIELSRDFYDSKGKIKSYEYTEFKQSGVTRWCDGEGKFGFHEAVLYENNLDEILKGTIWEYSAIKLFATHESGFGFQTFNYLDQYQQYPLIEYLVKSRLYKFTKQVIYKTVYSSDDINLSGKRLENILNINKSQLVIAQRIDAGKEELDVIRKANKANINLTDEQILFIAKNLRIERVIEMTQYATIHKMIKYIMSQATKGMGINDTFRDWGDYIRNCKVLEYDLRNDFVLFPRNLKEAHDIAYKLVQDNKNELFNKAIKEMSIRLGELYNWKYKNYMVIVPKTAEEIMKEGQQLHHCVGNYIERVAKGETIVLFLRHKDNPEEPYYTIEVDPVSKVVEQCRGKHNKSMDKDIEKVVQTFLKSKLEPLCYKAVG